MIEEVKYNDQLLALIVRNEFKKNGVEFFTPNDFSQQLGYMNRSKGYVIEPHIHNVVVREVTLTQEVLFIKNGKMKVDFYNDLKEFIQTEILYKGDLILLASGGHGFEMLEDCEFFEVKQGPYSGDKDKERF
jgi:hypothetical protein